MKKKKLKTRKKSSIFSKENKITEKYCNSQQDSILVSNYLPEPIKKYAPYKENLLERSRTQWQFGDWESLIKIKKETLLHHPDRVQLAILSAIGHSQLGNIADFRENIHLAQEWGCEINIIKRMIIAGVHNTLGRAAILCGDQESAEKHFESSIAAGEPYADRRLLSNARVTEQLKQLKNLLNNNDIYLKKNLNPNNQNNAYKACENNKITIRSIHHLSCTGGTLFTKCIAALPGVVVLNEIDPYSSLGIDKKGKGIFNPTNVIALLQQSFSDLNANLIDEVFLNEIETIGSIIGKEEKNLVLRDHSHSAYFVGNKIRGNKILHNILQLRFNTKSIVTVRDPIDSFLSLKHNNWIQFTPQTFDEYCFRYINFLKDHNQLNIFRYEDFIAAPEKTLQSICDILHLTYSTEFINLFPKFKFSGDSGRSGNIIKPRPRREYDENFKKEVDNSKYYKNLIETLGYKAL